MSDSGFVCRVRRKIDEMSQLVAAEKDPAERQRLTTVAAILVQQLERITADGDTASREDE